MTNDIQSETPAIVPFLKRDESGKAYLAGSRCGTCGEIFVGERSICAKCTARTGMVPVRLAETGKLYDFTVIYRSFPGVAVPFVDAIVDLDDGSHIKGTLLDVEPDPEKINFDMPVRLIYQEATPVNGGGKPYLAYFFVPA